ncbi:lysozyme inhibitor LprI family protein [Shewanella gelidii]|uniref:Lysozyme inhibitor LprI-like N-terminal domain-containing protein n=1 Tax=Shewanella gelidii TaxID=1642821 RepID=A0A917JZD6_9GAMM|nr:lysozyme inhibitor LprI family protein [Shewanella gelidii]MCL1098185.1 DUF1311 domain-containing protein [Shewanella gelidii]GGI91198.1 hypothetical protein GCM10009332_30630 [Shewanella gelidii]
MHKITYLVLLFIFTANAEDSSKLLKKELSETCGQMTSHKYSNYCLSKLEKRADVLLTNEYNSLVNYLKDGDKERLVDAQKKWTNYVSADCFFDYPESEKGGNYVQSLGVGCRLQHKLQRIKKLEDYNHNKGCNVCAW